MTTAFVLSGGASLAAVQVGMMQALAERDIRPDLLVGTSAGALNAAYVAGHGFRLDVLKRLADLWVDMRRSSVFPISAPRAAWAALGLRDSLCSPARLGDFLTSQLPSQRLEDAAVPVHLVAADVLSGRDVVLSNGDAATALLASCAIPGVFPSVTVDGRSLCDGALANNSGISHAVGLGADRIYLLPGGTSCALERPPRHPLAASLHAITLLLAQRALHETRFYADRAELHVLPPLCPLAVSSADFSHARELIERSCRSSRDWLDTGRDTTPRQEQFLSLHSHDPAGRTNQPVGSYHSQEEARS